MKSLVFFSKTFSKCAWFDKKTRKGSLSWYTRSHTVYPGLFPCLFGALDYDTQSSCADILVICKDCKLFSEGEMSSRLNQWKGLEWTCHWLRMAGRVGRMCHHYAWHIFLLLELQNINIQTQQFHDLIIFKWAGFESSCRPSRDGVVVSGEKN